jgi:ketosteroid isomerase-like protein
MSAPHLGKPLMFASAEECERSFYEAMDAADIEAMADLWLDDDDVCCIHPNGPRLIGYAAVKASWHAILSNGPVHLRVANRKSLDTPTVVTSNVVEETTVVRGRDQQVVHMIATNVMVKTNAGWKMVLHHASPAPGGRVVDVEAPQGPLH